MPLSTRRLRLLATAAFANAVTIVVTLFSGWTLAEATFAYVGELVIVVLIVYARVLAAKPRDGASPWLLRGEKAVAILTTLLMYGLVVGVMLLCIFGEGLIAGDGIALPRETWRAVAICWAAFLAAQVIAFVENFRAGAYDELIDDGLIMANFWRYPPLLLAGAAVALTRKDNVAVAPWFFMAALGFMAIVDTALYVVDRDSVNQALRRRRSTR